MTELLLLLAFLRQWSNVGTSCYIGLNHDIAFLERVTSFIHDCKADSYFASIITDLNRLDDAIVTGLSGEAPFSFETPFFKRKRNSVLPLFYYGPLSSVFDDQGKRRSRFDTVAVQFMLESLRLVRRAKSKAFTRLASDTAAAKFIDYQNKHRPGLSVVLEDMREMWFLFESQSDFLESVRYGFPGNGVTQDMKFPYVPSMCLLEDHSHEDPAVARTLIKAFSVLNPFGTHSTRYFSEVLSQCEFVGRYQFPSENVAKLSVVDKKFNEGRAITVGFAAPTIVAATARVSTMRHHALNGSISMVNVGDQESSHRVLEKNFDSVACLDLEGGSSCLTIKNLDYMLSKTTYNGALWKASRPTSFTWKGKQYPLTTLTMGDAMSVSLLTTTLWLVLVLAYMKYNEMPLTMDNFRDAVRQMRKLDLFRVVGDDMIFPDYLNAIVRILLEGIGVTVNERKSSRATSHHKESCGAWFISNGLKHVRRIYPFRAAVSQRRDYASVTQVIEQFVEKNIKSPFSRALFLAHTTILLPIIGKTETRLDYESALAYHPSIVGTPFGDTWSHQYRTVRASKQVTVPDALAYAFRLSESLCTPRWSRRPDVARFRVRKKSAALGSRRSKTEHQAIAIAIRMLAVTFPRYICTSRGRLTHLKTRREFADRWYFRDLIRKSTS